MMKDDKIYLDHIQYSLSKISDYLYGISYSEFLESEMAQDAVIRKLQVIGEATKKISMELRIKTPNIPWKEIAGMRDKLIHDYFDVDMEVVWNTVKNEIPELQKVIGELIIEQIGKE